AWYLSKVPYLEPPFDVDQFCRVQEIHSPNAFDHYREAYRLSLAADQLDGDAWTRRFMAAEMDRVILNGWKTASGQFEGWAVSRRPELEEWLRGTKCSSAVLARLRDVDLKTDDGLIQAMLQFAKLAKCDAMRLELQGKFAKSGERYRALLRSSDHISGQRMA